MAVIRESLEQVFGGDAAQSIPILYGGTVNAENARPILHAGAADGLFVGRYAWQPEGFAEILRLCTGAGEDVSNAARQEA